MYEKNLLKVLGFSLKENAIGVYFKKYHICKNYIIEVDFENKQINYGDLIKSENRTTQNFAQIENWVVLECINRLLENGYQPERIVLEKTWPAGHGTSSRLDICVTRDDGTEYLLIECKTYEKEFDKAVNRLKKDGGQLFTYFKFSNKADIIMLYSSKLKNDEINYVNEIINIEDEYRTGDVKDFYEKWNKLTKNNGIFDEWVKPYNFESKAITLNELKEIKPEDSSFIFNRFLEILRNNVVSDKPNAFNKIFTLFLCKIYDEKSNEGTDNELGFQWFYMPNNYGGKPHFKDDDITFQLRLTDLYKNGMREFFEKNVTDFSEDQFNIKFGNLSNTIKNDLLREFNKIRLEKNNEFAIKEVYDEKSFKENAKVVKQIVELLQNYKIRYAKKQQYLSDFFELLLTTGLKQEAGQFFTPVPIAQFIIKSLPIYDIVQKKLRHSNKDDLLPYIIDYASGSGHFVTESMNEIQKLLANVIEKDFKGEAKKLVEISHNYPFEWALQYIYSIEKDYRLVKVGKVGCYLHGDGLANVIHSDGLAYFGHSDYKDKLKEKDKDFPSENKQFDIVMSNPPYSVSAFKNASREYYGDNDFELYKSLADTSSEIECLFIERTKQLLKDGGLAGIILPDTILSNSGVYQKAREIILRYFDIIAITKMGSHTFMATTTRTVILFLRRRNNYDNMRIEELVDRFFISLKDVTINGIEKPVLKYINHVWGTIKLSDYITLIGGEPNEEIIAHETYKEYLKKYNIKNKESFFNIILDIEKDKLFYFILTYSQKIILVQTGEEIDAEKRFLGYEFSYRHGNEGIHPIQRNKTIDKCTYLFDSDYYDNPNKVSTYIYHAFKNDFTLPIAEELRKNLARINLVDVLQFGGTTFEKIISLNIKEEPKIDSKWNAVKLNEFAEIIRGVTYSKYDQTIEEGNNIILTSDNITLDGKLKINKKIYLRNDLNIPIEKVLKKNDIFICFSSGSKKHLGKVAFIDVDTNYYAGGFMGIIRITSNKAYAKYIYYLLNSLFRDTIRNIGSGSNISNLSSIITEIKIPIPPNGMQKKIINEIANLEEKAKTIVVNNIEDEIQKIIYKYI
jgi:type I restriction enzyme M protein